MSFVEGFSKNEIRMFVMLLSSSVNSDKFIKLYSIFDKDFILLVALFHGSTFKIPCMSTLSNYKTYAKIYIFLMRYNFSEEGYLKAVKIFNRRVAHLKAIVLKVDKELEILKRSLANSVDNTIDGIDEILELLDESGITGKYKSEQVDPGEVTETEKGDSFPEDQSGITEPDNQLYNPSEDISESTDGQN